MRDRGDDHRVDDPKSAGRDEHGIEELVVADDLDLAADGGLAVEGFQLRLVDERGPEHAAVEGLDPEMAAAVHDEVDGLDRIGDRWLVHVATVRARRERADDRLLGGTAHRGDRPGLRVAVEIELVREVPGERTIVAGDAPVELGVELIEALPGLDVDRIVRGGRRVPSLSRNAWLMQPGRTLCSVRAIAGISSSGSFVSMKTSSLIAAPDRP